MVKRAKKTRRVLRRRKSSKRRQQTYRKRAQRGGAPLFSEMPSELAEEATTFYQPDSNEPDSVPTLMSVAKAKQIKDADVEV
jgi:hypothetical protein